MFVGLWRGRLLISIAYDDRQLRVFLEVAVNKRALAKQKLRSAVRLNPASMNAVTATARVERILGGHEHAERIAKRVSYAWRLRLQIVISNRGTMRRQEMVIARPVESKILVLRGQKMILDADLAELYGVEVRHLNQQVKRHAKRFSKDFRFQLPVAESKTWRMPLSSVCVHRARRSHGSDGAEFRTGRGDEHLRGSRLLSHARGVGDKSNMFSTSTLTIGALSGAEVY